LRLIVSHPQVSEDDQLPKIMCSECSCKLNLMSDFKDKAHKAQTQLLSKVRGNKVKAEVILLFADTFFTGFCFCL
jgi:cellobiose-specific phosphotransferase system component IIA